MKKYYFLFAILSISKTLSAQDSLYSKVYYNTVGYKLEALAEDQTGHVVQVGSSEFDLAAFSYLDSLGHILNSSKYSIDGQPANNFNFRDVVATTSNEYFASGSVVLQNFGASVGVVAKLSNQGAVIWSKGVFTPAPGFFKCTDIIESAEQTLWIVGSDEQTGETAIIEFDTDGTQLSAFSFKVTGSRLEIQDIKELSDTLIFTGTVYANGGLTKGIVFALDKDGTFLWSNTISDVKFFESELNENSIWTAGHTTFSNPIIVSSNHTGEFRAMNAYDSSIGQIEDLDLAVMFDSTLAITLGNSYQSSLIVARVNSLDVTNYAVLNNAIDVISRTHNGIYIGGFGPNYGVKSLNYTNPHSNMIRLDSAITFESCGYENPNLNITNSVPVDASITLTTIPPASLSDLLINQAVNELNADFGCVDYYSGINELNNSLISLWPNPSNGRITVTNSNGTNGVIEILNTSGEIVFKTRIIASSQVIDLENLSSGIYFYQFSSVGQNAASSIGKIVVF